jgi:hypothetical protein
MPLPILNFPSITGIAGIVYSISSIQDSGAQACSWGIDQVEQIWQGSRSYTQRLRVLTTNAYVGSIAVINALQSLGIVLGSPYAFPLTSFGATEIDTGSYLQRIIPEMETEDGTSWIVTLEYGPFCIWHELGNSNINYGSFTPLDFPPIVRWSTNKYHRSYPTDINGYPFRNTAGDPLENPPQREESTQCLTLILWNSDYQEPFAQSYRDTINSDVFLGFDPTFVKCKDIDGERLYTSDYGYVWRIKYEFEIRRILVNGIDGAQIVYGWQDLVLNAGFRAFGGANGLVGAPLLPIIIGTVPVTSPMILNQDGTCDVPGNPQDIRNQVGDQTLYLAFNNFPSSEFAGLNIDQNILTNNQ